MRAVLLPENSVWDVEASYGDEDAALWRLEAEATQQLQHHHLAAATTGSSGVQGSGQLTTTGTRTGGEGGGGSTSSNTASAPVSLDLEALKHEILQYVRQLLQAGARDAEGDVSSRSAQNAGGGGGDGSAVPSSSTHSAGGTTVTTTTTAAAPGSQPATSTVPQSPSRLRLVSTPQRAAAAAHASSNGAPSRSSPHTPTGCVGAAAAPASPQSTVRITRKDLEEFVFQRQVSSG
jgi:hypothetical protein